MYTCGASRGRLCGSSSFLLLLLFMCDLCGGAENVGRKNDGTNDEMKQQDMKEHDMKL